MTARPTSVDGAHPLAPMQRPLWMSQRRHPGSPLLNMVKLSHFDGAVDVDRLSEAFADVVARSDTLSSRVVDDGSGPVVLAATGPAVTEVLEVSRRDALEWAERRLAVPIDVAVRPYDSVALRHEDGTLSWYLGLHHLVTDAASSALVFAATAAAYHGDVVALGGYDDWVRSALADEGPRATRARAHWAAREDAPRLGRLYQPVRTPRSASERRPVTLPSGLSSAMASDYRLMTDELSWTALLATATSVLVSKVTGAKTFSIGLPVHNRSAAETKQIIGTVMEVFPVDVEIAADDTFRSLHKRLGKAVMATMRHAAPGLAPAGDHDVLVNVIPGIELGPFGDIPVTHLALDPGAVDSSRLLQVQLNAYGDGGAGLLLDLNEAAAGPEHADRAAIHFATILDALATDPDAAIAELDIRTDGEIRSAEAWGTAPDFDTPVRGLVDQLREALQHRDQPVIDDGEDELSGRELWERSVGLARHLRAEGVVAGDRIAIRMGRRIDTVVAVLGTLVAGASYVPLDPDQPAARLDRLIERAGCVRVLTEVPQVQPTSEIDWELPAPRAEAYLLFTSGSTGEPKGVPITHLGLARYVRFAAEAYVAPGEQPVVALFTALTFDLTVTSLFVPLVAGGRTVVIAENGGAGLAALAERRDVTWAKATPSHLEVLVRLLPHGHALRTLVVGGEAFGAPLATRLRQASPGVRIFNEYGPTEAVVGCMIHEVHEDELSRWSEVPIGGPAPGVHLRVVDDDLTDVPFGGQGELLIAHVGLTDGYLDGASGDSSPFVELDGRRWYRSGDLVRMVDDETLVYLGRIDEQVKVGGIRLEPIEVEHALERHPSVARAAVRLWSPPAPATDTPILAAWVQPQDGTALRSPTELRAFLADSIPIHAIPAAFVEVGGIPLTANGKLDTAALPPPAREHRSGSGDHVAPETAHEHVVTRVWEALLGITPIGLDDDFFGLGGDSLAAMQMVVAVGDELDVHVREELAFLHTTPRTLAAALVELGESGAGSDPAPLELSAGEAPRLSVGELSILFDEQANPGTSRYNVGRVYRVGGAVDPGRLADAVRDVAQLHVPLHWSFGSTRRRLGRTEAVDVDVRSTPVGIEVVEAALADAHRTPFDLDGGALLRCVIQPVVDGSTAVLLVMHHVSGDAESFDILWRQVDRRYQGFDVAPPDIDIASFAAWQAASIGDADRAFWAHPSSDAPGRLCTHVPHASDPAGFAKRRAGFTPADLQAGPGRTGFATVLGAFAAVLRRRTDEDRVGLGILASTRNHPAATDLVGYLLNTLPIELDCGDAASLGDLIAAAGVAAADAIARRTVPYAEIVAARREAGERLPTVDVLLAFDHLGTTTLGSHPVQHHVMFNGDAVAGSATVFVETRDDAVDLSIEFNGRAFSESDAQALLADLDTMVQLAITAPETRLGDAPLPSDDTRTLVGPSLEAPETVRDRIAEHIKTLGDRPAVVCEGAATSWEMLGRRADDLAAALRSAGVAPGDRVVLCLPRSVDLVASVLASHLVGAAYVPIDPTYPDERIALIADLAQARAALVSDGVGPFTSNDIVASQVEPAMVAPPAPIEGDDTAYVIFTSGSTGTPRGVPVPHRALAASTEARVHAYEHQPGAFLVVSSPAFDSSVAGLFWALVAGGTVVLPTDSEAHDPDALLDLFETADVTHTLLVPTLYQAMLERGAGRSAWPTQVVVAGEACPPRLVDRHHQLRPSSALANEYGPTECTVWATVHHCSAGDDPVPIGPPIAGTWLEVHDTEGRSVPAGVIGELIIGGAGVVDAYLDDEPSTERRFGTDASDRRFFRTGDRAVFADGTVHFLGRLDDQLNVGGMRAEPEEIERVLLADDAVGAAVVVAADPRTLADLIDVAGPSELAVAMGRAATADDPAAALGDALREFADDAVQLVAHLESAGRGSIDLRALRTRAQAALPAPLRPQRYVVHEALPRSANGKVDRAAAAVLPIPSADVVADRSPAAGPLGGAIVAAFREVLGISDVDPGDSFFDLGGHSLLALQLLDRIEELVGVKVTVTSLYGAPTPASLAALIGDAGEVRDQFDYVVPVQPEGSLPPIFGVHVLGVNAEYYRPLAAHLGSDQPVYGLGIASSLADATAPTEVDRIAALYADELERLVPEGPVLLAAVSIGAAVTFELGRLLRARGRDVPLIALFDAAGPDAAEAPGASRRRARNHLDQFRTSPTGYARDRSVALGMRGRRAAERAEMWARDAAGVDQPDRLKIRRFIEANVQAAIEHRIRPWDGRLVVFKAEEDPFGWVSSADDQLGWGSVARGGLEIISVPGGHTTMLAEPHVPQLARSLADAGSRAIQTRREQALLSLAEVEDLLVDGLHAGRFVARVADLRRRSDHLAVDARELVDGADAALRAVAAVASDQARSITAELASAGVDGVLAPVPSRMEHASLVLRTGDPDGAVGVLAALGYRLQDPLSGGAWRAYRRIRSSITVIKLDDATTRVTITWADDVNDVGARSAIAPTKADLTAIDLPGPAWPLYWAIRPFRLVNDRLRRRRAGGDLGPYLGTPTGMVTAVLSLAEPDDGELVVDIGCGDARVLIEAARRFGCRGRGIERDPELVARARRNVAAAGLADRIEIVEGDAATVDLSDADVVFAFLPTDAVSRLLEHTLDTLRPGARFVSHEQVGASWPVDPETSRLVVADGVTVASVWHRR